MDPLLSDEQEEIKGLLHMLGGEIKHDDEAVMTAVGEQDDNDEDGKTAVSEQVSQAP